ncbi:type III toxin-antitoxin system ToxN/AbiQ family toxin [Leuconostoc mesenteroides]|uniref:type III toxin-antitoxin system ToxN/AbiQ family toxin n=1 Tax=Leuconostoc mesenteroides TaxID=1245 RepID=UPI00123A0013|nr:type III toxin-antitoxin system ToxN/AbiQ family toxin [Leuconostoc mesenteroides]KAA8345921.1 type III toxin-antitoxin system ToxN/AbiQ family toxin [Leuconostoc mesenteroides]
MKIYNITDKYINYLKKYDNKIPENKHEKRPFIGVIVIINGYKYFAPLSSPKLKHKHMKNTKDFHKIDEGKMGVINFNNMIPVPESELIIVDIANINNIDYRNLLNNQLSFITSINSVIENKAKNLRSLFDKQNPTLAEQKIIDRCVIFPKIEGCCDSYK